MLEPIIPSIIKKIYKTILRDISYKSKLIYSLKEELDTKHSCEIMAKSKLEISLYDKVEKRIIKYAKKANLNLKNDELHAITLLLSEISILEEKWEKENYHLKLKISIKHSDIMSECKKSSTTFYKDSNILSEQKNIVKQNEILVANFTENNDNIDKIKDEYYKNIETLLFNKYLITANTLNRKCNYEEAINYSNKAIKLKPNDAFGYKYLGFSYGNKDDNENAIKAYKKAVEIEPNFTIVYNSIGVIYGRMRMYDESIKALKKVIELEPTFYYAYNNLGSTYSKFGDYENAIKYLKKAVEIKPDYPLTYNNLGIAYKLKQCYNKAIEYYEKAIEVEPNYHFPFANLARVYKTTHEYDKSISYYKKAIKVEPSVGSYNNMGNVYLKMGELYGLKKYYNNAIKSYEKAIEIEPNFPATYNNMGVAYFKKGSYEKAIECYNKANDISPCLAYKQNIIQVEDAKKGIFKHDKIIDI